MIFVFPCARTSRAAVINRVGSRPRARDASVLNELRARRRIRRLVGHRPEDDRCVIARSIDLFIQLLLGLGQYLGILELQRPVHGILRPDQHTHAIGGAQHGFLVRIVGQAREVTTKLLHPAEQRLRILIGIGATGAIRRFCVNANTTQEDRLAIQKDLGARGLQWSESPSARRSNPGRRES